MSNRASESMFHTKKKDIIGKMLIFKLHNISASFCYAEGKAATLSRNLIYLQPTFVINKSNFGVSMLVTYYCFWNTRADEILLETI